ncbi:MAG: hypothetical protein H7841_09485 [Magnetospirillum sp. WYHS-4]
MNPLEAAMDIADLFKGDRSAKLQGRAIAAEAEAKAQQIQQATAMKNQRLAAQQRQALGTQRARFGAMGLDSGSGSGQAVLDGLASTFDDEAEANRSLAQMRLDEIGESTAYKRQQNLLDASHRRMQWLFSNAKRFLPSKNLLSQQ